MPPVRTRSGYTKREPYPLNQFPESVIQEIGKGLVHHMAISSADISGDAFCRIFADAIEGEALGKPLGVVDARWNGCGWSVKTVKTLRNSTPYDAERVRLISGRNNPNYSAGISDPLADIQATGKVVLEIYNSRISEAREEYGDLRFLVFIRNLARREFVIFERPIDPIVIDNYSWSKNVNGNLEGHQGQKHVFTWQPHGSQFTIIEDVPPAVTRFSINQQPSKIPRDHVLEVVGFVPEWIEINTEG